MQMYKDYLTKKGLMVIYIEYHNANTLIQECATRNITLLNCYDPVDIPYQPELEQLLHKAKITLQLHETPLFLSPATWINAQFKNNKKTRMQSFYIAQRKRMGILVDKQNKPIGGK